MQIPIVIFAQVPPPEHGQSRMVQLGLDALRSERSTFSVYHINARFSESLDDIGESSLRKGTLIGKYLFQALCVRFKLRAPLLYYVPGPVKWSAVVRDWLVLGFLRLFYRKVVFHWHAIGQGEWARGSERLSLEGPLWLDRIARKISGIILDRPFASLCVIETSDKDAKALNSRKILTVHNGLADPCPDYDTTEEALRASRSAELRSSACPIFRILFLSHGTVEKGLLDAVEAIDSLLKKTPANWKFHATFAGGVSEELQSRFERDIKHLREGADNRLSLEIKGYVHGENKLECYRNHDIFLAPSHWESFGLTVAEAMAFGMQIVAAASDGVTGVLPLDHPHLAPVRRVDLLCEELQHCCEDILSGKDTDHRIALRKRFVTRYQISDFSARLIQGLRSVDPEHTPIIRHDANDSKQAANHTTPSESSHIVALRVYLADQNPGYDRSFGISRMSQVVLDALKAHAGVRIEAITSRTSQSAPASVDTLRVLPWGTRRKWVRLATDHLHPLFKQGGDTPDIYYFPKGYLPLLGAWCRPSVVTIHDTIIQYDEDHYPNWRNAWEYRYWAMMLKHTLRSADRILTVSESSKRQIQDFMDRHRIPRKEITVTYEPCLYENIPQPGAPPKDNYVIHLASCEPHKRTAHLVRWWHEAESEGRELPMLHLIGTIPPEVAPLLASSRSIVKRPFLEDGALQAAYLGARALILPSEIEGFGLPALEAYYLGTPVCFVRGTSVEEILGVGTNKGGFTLESPDSLFAALNEVESMSSEEVRDCGLKLRETYAATRVAERMIRVFEEVKNRQGGAACRR